MKLLSRVRLFATPWTVAHQASLSMGFSRQEILEWVAISSSSGSCLPRNQTHVSWISCTGRWILSNRDTWEANNNSAVQFSSVTQSCLTLCDPMNCSPPGSSVHGIFQARNTGVGCHFLLQGIFLTKEVNQRRILRKVRNLNRFFLSPLKSKQSIAC